MDKRWFFWANHCPKICCSCVHNGAPDLIYPGTSLYEHILWMHLEKNRTYACTFPVQRKEINVVKVRFTMRCSSRKLSNDKVITTACNFWRKIACTFQVMSGNILFLGNKIFEIPPFFQTRQGDLGKNVHACSLRFSALNVWECCVCRCVFSQSSHSLVQKCPMTYTSSKPKNLELDLEF